MILKKGGPTNGPCFEVWGRSTVSAEVAIRLLKSDPPSLKFANGSFRTLNCHRFFYYNILIFALNHKCQEKNQRLTGQLTHESL